MQNPPPTEDDKASISTENVGDDPHLNRTVNARRKAAKRTLPWDLSVNELELMSPQQGEDIPARKKPRLEEPLPATTEEELERQRHMTFRRVFLLLLPPMMMMTMMMQM
jgi:hypothetical protein